LVDVAKAVTVLVSFDIDGTMEFGKPTGPIPATVARDLIQLGCIVGVGSDWPLSSQAPLWASNGVNPHFLGGKHDLVRVKSQFTADRYVHVGDTDIDRHFARLAGFEFIHVAELATPVTATNLLG
jgi:hypothetical protein